MSHCKHLSDQVQRRVARQSQKVDATHFFNLLTGPELLTAVEANLPAHRERQYPPTVTLAMFMGQALRDDGSCQNAVDAAMVARLVGGLGRGSVNTAGYCQARQRLPQELVSVLTQVTSTLLDSRSPRSWLWEGRHVKLVDGTTVLLPDTEENQARFPQHGKQATGAGFPLARLVAVISLSTGSVLAGALGPHKGKGAGEQGLLRRLTDCFVAGDILLADSYYCTYFLIAEMQQRGVDVLFEQHGARLTDFRKGQKLGERDHQVSWSKPPKPQWMSLEEYQRHPDAVTVREAQVGKKVLVTTMLHRRQTPKGKLGDLFWQRWHVELDIRNIKTTLKMDRLSCLSPMMCEKEMWVYFLAYNLIRILMAESALQMGVLPRQLSFKHTVQVWTAWSQRQFVSEKDEDLAGLFSIIAEKQVGKRPGRMEPRVVKRREKPYARMNRPREELREEIRKYGHSEKLTA
jgi:hypothetical protein